MKQLFFFIGLFTLASCDGQKETGHKVALVDQLLGYYNREHYDSIFYLFSPEMQAALPIDKTNEFFSSMQTESGRIIKHEYIDKKEGFDRYRADFIKGIYWLSIAQDTKNRISGLYFRAYDGPMVNPVMIRNSTKLSLPFYGEWYVFWGGDTKDQNYHVVSRAQKNAFDLVIMDEKQRSFKTDGKTNEDYYAFGQALVAPCNAEVVSVTEGVKDNNPGEMNPGQVTGNTVILKTAAGEYILMAHFKMGSINVKKGESVQKGQLLGLCGNSGNSSEPHLHFHIQDKEFMAGATGVKCYFEKLFVNGQEKTDYSPVKAERIKNMSN